MDPLEPMERHEVPPYLDKSNRATASALQHERCVKQRSRKKGEVAGNCASRLITHILHLDNF